MLTNIFVYSSIVIAIFINKGCDAMTYKSISGYHLYESKELDDVHLNGALELIDTYVTGMVTVNGNLKAIRSDIGTIKVNGHCTLKNSVVRQSVSINGSLTSSLSKIHGTLSVSSENTLLEETLTGDIIIKPVKGHGDVQVLVLDSCDIKGSIDFEGKNGKVIILNSTRVTGKITGAMIVKE